MSYKTLEVKIIPMHHKCIIDHEITSYAINIAEYQLMRLDKFSMHTNAYSDRNIR